MIRGCLSVRLPGLDTNEAPLVVVIPNLTTKLYSSLKSCIVVSMLVMINMVFSS